MHFLESLRIEAGSRESFKCNLFGEPASVGISLRFDEDIGDFPLFPFEDEASFDVALGYDYVAYLGELISIYFNALLLKPLRNSAVSRVHFIHSGKYNLAPLPFPRKLVYIWYRMSALRAFLFREPGDN